MDEDAELRLLGEITALQAALDLCLRLAVATTARLDNAPMAEVTQAMLKTFGTFLPRMLAATEADGNDAAAAGFERRMEMIIANLRTSAGLPPA